MGVRKRLTSKIRKGVSRLTKSKFGKTAIGAAGFLPAGRAIKGVTRLAKSKAVRTAALVGAGALGAKLLSRKGGKKRTRSRTGIPKSVNKWLSKKERELDKLAKASKVMKKISQLNFRAPTKKGKGSEGIITASEAREALRR